MTKKQKEVAVSQGQVPAEVAAQIDMGQETEFDRDDLAIPFIRIIQALSPQLKRTKAEYLEEAEEGMLFNTASGELIDGEKGLILIPAKYTRSFTEWAPKRGGLIADHGNNASILEHCTRGEKGGWIHENGNDIAESALYYVVVFDPETGLSDHAVLTLSGTQWPKARKWNTMMRKLKVQGPKGFINNPAPFAGAYLMTTVAESNDQGDWYGVKIVFHDYTLNLENGPRLLAEAVLLRQSTDKLKIDHSAGERTTQQSTTSDYADDDVAF